MKVRTRRRRIACLSAAVTTAALVCGTAAKVQARDLTWDADGAGGALGADGGGTWDLTSQNWVDGDLVTGTNTTWSNAPADSAIFGNSTSTVPNPAPPNNFVDLFDFITVQNMTLGVGTNGSAYSISDFQGGSLTLLGNVTKNGGTGVHEFLLVSGPLTLAAGDHQFIIRDSPGDVPEIAMSGSVAGPGGITIDNGPYEAWGTMVMRADNSYTGATNINKGRLVITSNNGLGTSAGGTTIANQGTLSIGGAGTSVPGGGLNLSEPITITRNTYTGGEFARYTYAIFSANGSGNHTFSGPFTIDSTDARIRVETSTVTISSNITAGATPNPVLTVDGDFAGFVNLTGNNTGLATGGVKMMGGVELNVSSEANLGGATAPITFSGGTFHPVGGFMTNFGSHPINNSTFSGGFDVDNGQTFTIDQPLGDSVNAVGSLGKRGLGTLNLNSVINLRGGQTFFDAGIVNVNNAVTLHSLHLRSPVVNIGNGGSITTTTGFNSLGQDSTGTNGGPDKAVVNITGNGQLVQTNNVDFNVSDNANTEGTINLQDNGVLTVGGLMHVAKNAGGKGTINQSGGTFTLNRNGNFTLVLGSRNGTGTYNLSGGTMTSAGEFYVGQGGSGVGIFNMTGGTVNQNNWFVVGREGGQGTVDMSAGTFNKAGGGSAFVGEQQAATKTSTMTVRGTAVWNQTGGEFWVGQGGGSGILNLQDTASFTVNNWFALGRASGASVGVFNMSGGTFTKAGGGFIAVGSGGSGTFNQTGGTINSNGTRVAEASSGTMNLSGGASTFTGEFSIGYNDNTVGTLNISNTANVTVPAVVFGVNSNNATSGGVLNLNGGTLTGTNFTAGASTTAIRNFKFNGGLLKPSADSTNFIGAKITSIVSTGGARIDSNAHVVTVNSALTHDSALSGADGGLTKSGTGTLTSAGVNTYTGPTVASAGKLALGKSLTTSSSVSSQNDATIELSSDGSHNLVIKTGPVSIAAAARIDLKDNKLITSTAPGTATGGTYNALQGEVQRAYDFGGWDQPGLTTSMPDAAAGLTTIGISTGEAMRGLGPTDTDTFAGQTITGASTIAMYTYAGDANLDGVIDGGDYGIIDNFAQIPGANSYFNGDFNYDGVIDGGDYGIIDNNIQAQGAPFPTSGAVAESAGLSGVTAVPEPSAFGLVVLTAAGLLGGRRRRRRSVREGCE